MWCGVSGGAVIEKAGDAPRPLSPEESLKRAVLPEGVRMTSPPVSAYPRAHGLGD